MAGNQLVGSLASRLADGLDDVGDWSPLLQTWLSSDAGRKTVARVDERVAAGRVVYPADPFTALKLTPKAATKVLILGQDPYHGPGQAEGLAFSVPVGHKLPPSLRNMQAELQRDLGLTLPEQGSLRAWAAQGVLLLNTVLTVEEGDPASHAGLGWQLLTSLICADIADAEKPIVVMLWGSHAQKHWLLSGGGRPSRHTALQCNHPSPLSARRPPAPFLGCGHFGLANQALVAAGRTPVVWGHVPAA